MKKYIYKIINIINNKCYIGQSKDYEKRWKEHKYLLNNNKHDNKHLQNAWNKYGEKNFKIEVIEYVKNYNEREIYWISFYNSTNEQYGYNIMTGGEEPPHINGSKLSKEQAETIQNMLIHASSINEVAAMFPNITKGHICKINSGSAWMNPKLQYPLCTPRPEVFTDKEVDEIIEELKRGDLTQKEIAKKHNCARTAITAINLGVNFHRDNVKYPIRESKICKLTTTDVNEIMELLKNSSEDLRHIANIYNTTISSIYDINVGKRHRNITQCDEYPIRK